PRAEKAPRARHLAPSPPVAKKTPPSLARVVPPAAAPVVAEVVPVAPNSEAEVAARWQALKAQMQKQIRSSDWDGAWDTVDDMLAIKPYDREVLEARDYLEERRSRPKAKAQKLSTRRLDEEVLRILKEANCGACLTPDIPAAKLQNAMQSCRVPPGEKVLALID